ncbi:MAG: pilin [archaeon]
MNRKILALALIVAMVLPIAVSAVDIEDKANLTDEQKEAKEDVESYMWNIASLIQGVGLVIGVVALMAGGILFMVSSEDPAKRDQAKNVLKMGIGGAMIIFLAPTLMTFLLG